MNRLDDLLFSENSLGDVLRAQLADVRKQVDAISKDRFLANSNEEMSEYVFAKTNIKPVEIHSEHITISEPTEIKITKKNVFDDIVQVAGIEIFLSIPYTGETDLWNMQPSSFNSNPPRGNIKPNYRNDQEGKIIVRFEYFQNEFQADEVNKEIEKTISSIQQFLDWIKKDIETHNSQIRMKIDELVQARRERLGIIQDVTKLINIPIGIRNGEPNVSNLPIQKRIIKPLASHSPSKPEYGISDETYTQILGVMRHEGATYERTPKTYAKHNEEELRDILLAHLNGHFKGQATGETFRKNGKTDICIEAENRAAFIAECKVWHGEKHLIEAINQLLSYLTWRDVKTALVIFNKNVAGFKSLLEKMPALFENHPNKITQSSTSANEWNLRIRAEDDQNRIINIRVFLFNLYVKS